MTSRPVQQGLSSLLTFGIVCFTKYSVLPWILLFLHSRKYESWAHVVVAYGLLLSSLNLGIYLGQSISSQSKPFTKAFHLLLFFTLTSSYSTIAFITRFPLTVILFFLVGMTGSMLVINGQTVDQRRNNFSFASIISSSSSIPTASQASSSSANGGSEFDSDVNSQRYMIAFIFSTLVGAILYDTRPHVDFPCYFLSLFLTIVCMIITSYKVVRKVRRNRKLSSSGASAYLQRRAGLSVGNGTGRGRSTGGGTKSNMSGGRNNSKGGGTGGSGEKDKAIANFEEKILNNDNQANIDNLAQSMDYQGEVPINFYSACRGDLNKARKMYAKTLAWRQTYDVDNLMDLPQQTFYDILQYYPHAIHGYSLDGCAVVYEILGKGNPTGLKNCQVTIEDLVWHFNLRNELIFNKLTTEEYLNNVINDPKTVPGSITKTNFPYPYPTNANGLISNIEGVKKEKYIPRVMTVIDVEGISISSVTTDVISFIKKSGEIIDTHYPEQVARLVVCKAPRWFSTIWTVIARALPETVQKKVDILYDAKGLDKYIHPSQRPISYGGTEEIELEQSELHKSFLGLAEEWEKKYGLHESNTIEGEDNNSNNTTNITTNTSSLSTSLTSKGRGMFNWISSKFRTGSTSVGIGIGIGSSSVQQAYLGEKNTYKYNENTGKWEMDNSSSVSGSGVGAGSSVGGIGSSGIGGSSVLSLRKGRLGGINSNTTTSNVTGRDGEEEYYDGWEDDDNDDDDRDSWDEDDNDDDDSSPLIRRSNSNEGAFSPKLRTNKSISSWGLGGSNKKRGRGKGKGRMTKEQLEEHGLVLAIHAAHYAATYAKISAAATAAGNDVPPPLPTSNGYGSNANVLASYPSTASLTNMEYGRGRGYGGKYIVLIVYYMIISRFTLSLFV